MSIRSFLRLTAGAAVAALWSGAFAPAHAQSAGSFLVRAGVTEIAPDTRSGDLSAPSFAGTKASVGANAQATAGLTWMWTNHIGLDLPLNLGFKHDITGDGSIAGVGKIGEVRALPAALFVQYRFGAADATVRPYLGAGPTRVRFYAPRTTAAFVALTAGSPGRPTTMTVDSQWTATAQAGLVWRLTPQWSIDAAYLYTPLKTRINLSSGQTLDTTLNPTSVSLGIAYRF